MKRKVSWALTLAIVLMVFAGCSANRRLSEEAKLKQELRKFESFSGSGIVELSALGFSMRKPFVLAKNLDQMRLDMIEGGVFGATGAPLLSLYLGEYFALKSTMMPALEALNLQDKLPMKPNAVFNTADFVFERYGQEIILNKAVQRDELKITFRKNYQLESIVDGESGTRIDAKYTGRGDLDELIFRSNKGVSARMIFDKVEYGQSQIMPLPKPEPNENKLMELFKQGGMMEMFKGFLGN